jgi:hypothetical protein
MLLKRLCDFLRLFGLRLRDSSIHGLKKYPSRINKGCVTAQMVAVLCQRLRDCFKKGLFATFWPEIA